MTDTAGGDAKRWARARLGRVIKGKYRLDDVIGVGGMAVVFRATHRNQAEFAIKMLLPELSFRQDLKTRFLREGYAANSVKHPGVVQVVDDDEAEDGAAFLVMELLEGDGVDALWAKRNHNLPVMAAVGIVDQLLDVLAAAHDKGIIHRDIKPANLFLTTDGTLKVLDFGIARVKDAMASSAQGTHTGMLLGTPAFMAPEQAKGLTSEIDARTDVWAAGATLFTLVCGEFVHKGETPSLLLINSATTPARSLASVASHIPPALAAVTDKALAFDKTDRWQHAGAMRDALRAAHRTTYGSVPSRETLLAALSSPSPATAATILPQHTVPLTPLSSAPPARAVSPAAGSSMHKFVGGTTAQPVSSREAAQVPRRSMLPFALGAGVVAVGVALVVVLKILQPSGAGPATSISAGVTAMTASSVAPPVPFSETHGIPQQPSASTTKTTSTAPTNLVPATSAATHVSAPVSAQPSATHATAMASGSAKPPPSCQPPFTIDADGHKLFKKDCL